MHTNSTPSSTLDTVTTEPHTCTFRTLDGTYSENTPNQMLTIDRVSDECGAEATHEVIITCCDNRVTYRCTTHTNWTGNTVCRKCKHRCEAGVCYHRIVVPL